MNRLQKKGVRTIGVGKIANIFNDMGFDESYPEKGNRACIERTLDLLKRRSDEAEFIFVNLVDTDQEYGHRRDPVGYHDAVARIDAELPRMYSLLSQEDQFIVTADHGCDPTFRGSDHTREYVPLLVRNGMAGSSLGAHPNFTQVAKLVEEWLL